MKLTLASRYAIHAVVHLASLKKKDAVASHLIAEARGISDRFLLKVLKPLVSQQILISEKGPNGGYRLARLASEISMLDVLEAVDGPIRGHAPPGKGEKESPLAKRLEIICNHCAEQCRKHLDKIKISELVSG
jgi:Rrf2 family transcriptional regulator, iron-sulfur cluster assembly transcription factor